MFHGSLSGHGIRLITRMMKQHAPGYLYIKDDSFTRISLLTYFDSLMC